MVTAMNRVRKRKRPRAQTVATDSRNRREEKLERCRSLGTQRI